MLFSQTVSRQTTFHPRTSSLRSQERSPSRLRQKCLKLASLSNLQAVGPTSKDRHRSKMPILLSPVEAVSTPRRPTDRQAFEAILPLVLSRSSSYPPSISLKLPSNKKPPPTSNFRLVSSTPACPHTKYGIRTVQQSKAEICILLRFSCPLWLCPGQPPRGITTVQP